MTKRKNEQAFPENGSVLFIPLNKLKKSPRNARKTPHPKADIEGLAASIASNGMLQAPVVEPEVTEGKASGFYLVTIGEGRRQAQLLRAKRKEIAKSEPIRCLVDTEHNALEISLAENAIRSEMHPADQFDAFLELHRDHGLNAEDIAARFGVTPAVVKQRLKLAVISPVLMKAYRDEELNLDQLTAFAFTDDHAKQEQVFEALGEDADREDILSALNEEHLPATDPRAVFVGLDAYQAAGGAILRDLFDDEIEGFLTDPVLLHRLAEAKLQGIADAVKAEGWKWVEIMPRLDHSMTSGMRRIYAGAPTPSAEAQAQIDALQSQYDALCDERGESEETEAELNRLEQEIADLEGEDVFDPAEVSRAGVIVSISREGEAHIARGYVRREDEDRKATREKGPRQPTDGPAPLSDKLIAELTAHRTMAIRNALGQNPGVALVAVVHAFAGVTFYSHADRASCLEIRAISAHLGSHAPGVDETAAAQDIEQRHERWAKHLPDEPGTLWDFVLELESGQLLELLAHCVSATVDAVRTPRSSEDAKLDHADQLARAVHLDMRTQWTPTAESYFGRVSKERILEAVREGVSKEAADNLASMKKQAMAEQAEKRLQGRGWLPPILRMPEPETSEPMAMAAE
ncbi:ParB family chromosome partitioning protein [Rhodopseudomonas rhenobacensis]|uniref:ParB family chromosome partitioning protein n=1 Tax=Rhodopseudomonas rhenobacensis TaxID=87461 RepID=A0A7W7Z5V0_9BRAD|nr:ParB/RepB/Spo0J family partition protein [Rhodopseudomonas rhenobacensis]MBB5048539.1 ParB family chromosome partitioning protein [Rhodopseudomonas rhenobacensis]